MANKTIWSRICKAFSGSDKKEGNSSELSAEEAAGKHIAEEMKKFRRAVYQYDVKTVHEMLENGYNVNRLFRRDAIYVVDGQYTVEDFEYYTIFEVAGEPMKSLLRAYGGKTYAEIQAEEDLKRKAQQRLATAQRDAAAVERMRVRAERKKQAESGVAAILA